MATSSPINIRVLDGDLGQKLPEMKQYDFVIPKTFSIENTVMAIYDGLKGRKVSRMTLICHGAGEMTHGELAVRTGATVVLPGTRSHYANEVCKIYGGYGLFLGKDQLTLENYHPFWQLNSCFTDKAVLEICGCAAADVGPTVGGISGDGRRLMSKLASVTGISVRAPLLLQRVEQNWYLGIADRTAFVGPTYLFDPSGNCKEDTACY